VAASRARRLDPTLHAFVTILDVPRGTAHGRLAGLPYAAKDLVDLAGRAPTLGLAQPVGAIPAEPAAVIEILRDQGARLIGLTAMSELAYEPSGGNAQQGRPFNPWSAGHICGGSSSGSAVAVAAGIVPVALGSDTAGSLRIPAHCCGVTAWKPSHGLVPVAGTMALAPSLDTIGFLARAAADLLPVAETFWTSGMDRDGVVQRVALDHDLVAGCDADIAGTIAEVLAILQQIGVSAVAAELQPLIAACDAPVLTLLQGEAAASHRLLLDTGRLDKVLSARIAKGATMGPADTQEAHAALVRLAGDALDAVFGDADAILLPVMRMRTPTVLVCDPQSPAFSARVLYELSALTRWVNGLGLPAVAVPCGFDRGGLPMAAQLVGRPHQDAALLDLAVRLQSRTDWHDRVPTGAPRL
jgi:Asp-tRNA(Asn)/Glu-tRNA(Gln) amidotransferase A subunit family amidase